MSQLFLLSAVARTLSLSAVARMSDEEAHAKFVAIRWAENNGQAFCPKCGCVKVYAFATRKLWKCSACHYQFSVTARTIFQDRKRPIRDYLLAIAIFVNGAKGHSALQLSRDLDVQYRTAFVLAHKIRESMAAETANAVLSGTVEIDGCYLGGHIKPANYKEDRKDRRLLFTLGMLAIYRVGIRGRFHHDLTAPILTTLIDRQPHECSWIIGDARHGRMCGRPIVRGARWSWCETHLARGRLQVKGGARTHGRSDQIDRIDGSLLRTAPLTPPASPHGPVPEALPTCASICPAWR